MDENAYLRCSKCGAQISVDDPSVKCHEEEGVLVVHYSPAHRKVILINAETGSRHTVDVSEEKATAKPASRQIGGIIGPY
ncbi:MAG: hypothetical protein ACHP8A_01050 [Terriglobales bacterium]|nr:hypothetical protein [Terriglobales bacterium]